MAGGGVDGTTIFAGGGIQNVTIGSSNLPANIPYKDPGHSHIYNELGGSGFELGTAGGATIISTNTSVNTVGITINPSTSALGTGNFFQSLPPSYVGGITMIRAA